MGRKSAQDRPRTLDFADTAASGGVAHRVLTASLHPVPPTSDLSFAGLELLDGERWTLSRGGIGRPFAVRMLLVNRGTRPVRLWQPGTGEGDACPRILLAGPGAEEIVLRPPPALRVPGVPQVTTLEAGRLLRLDLDLLRLVGPDSPPPGVYHLRGLYENVLPRSMGVDAVWTGRVASEPRDVTIAAP